MHEKWFSDGKGKNKVISDDDLKKKYKSQLLLSDGEIEMCTNTYMHRYDQLVKVFLKKTALTRLDMRILIFTAGLQTLRWAILTNDTGRFANANDADESVADIGGYLPATFESLLKDHTVPYDAITRSERFKDIYPGFSTGIAGNNHRYTTLGHDPIAGWVVGTANIATNTLTVNHIPDFPSYHILNQQFDGKTNLFNIMKWTWERLLENPALIGAAFLKQCVHYGTDIFTKQGLPVPCLNILSPEAATFLGGGRIDVYSIGRGAILAILINKLVEMFHRLFFNPLLDDKKIYEVRTRKIIMYSNTCSSVLNIAYTGLTRDLKRLDVGGLLVTLWRLFTDRKAIRKIEMEFINKTLDGELQKEEDEVKQRLAKYGIEI